MYKLIELLLFHVTGKSQIFDDQVFINDCEFIHIDSWAKDDIHMSMIFNRVDGKSHSQILTYDVVVRKIT